MDKEKQTKTNNMREDTQSKIMMWKHVYWVTHNNPMYRRKCEETIWYYGMLS